MRLRNLHLLLLSVSIWSCKHNAAVQVTPAVPVIDTITHIDSFKGTFYYSREEAERSTEDWRIRDSVSSRSTVYVVYLKDSIRIYDNFRNKYYDTSGHWVTDNGWDTLLLPSAGLFLSTTQKNDSSKYQLLGNYFLIIKNDSLKYANGSYPTLHKGGYVTRQTFTFSGKKAN